MPQGIMNLFEGADLQNLSEDFKSKVQVIFESAVSAKVQTIREEMEAKYADQIKEQAETAIQEMEVKVNDYLTYIADEWLKENKLAVDKGIRTEISESFLTGLKDLFTEHYVEIPDDKVDVVTEMAGNIDQLEQDRNVAINENIALKGQLASLKKDKIVRDLSENLADSEKDKLNRLVAEIAFEDEKTFKDKLCTIAEAFLGKNLCEGSCTDDKDKDDDSDDDDDKKKKMPDFMKKKGDKKDGDGDGKVNESMNAYLAAITKTKI